MPETTECFAFDAARSQWGDRVDFYQTFLHQADPLADNAVAALAKLPAGRGSQLFSQALEQGIETVPEAPEALQLLFRQVDHIPWWVDWDRIDRGAQVLRQVAIPSVMMLALYSLPLTYSSPAGTKPLVSTKYLVDRAARRLAETSAFVRLTCMSGGLKRFGKGFKMSLRVRLMHAQVRRLLLNSGRWHSNLWATPINQAHMAGTLGAISAGVILKLQTLGFKFTPSEIDSVLHLWRYSGYLSGVNEALICTTLTDALQLSKYVWTIEGSPDQDCIDLVKALTKIPMPLKWLENMPGNRAIVQSMARVLLEDPLADALALPKCKYPLKFTALFLLKLFSLGYRLQFVLPGGRQFAANWGVWVWEWTEDRLFQVSRHS